MTEENNNTIQKDSNKTSNTNRSNNYYRYKKKNSVNKSTDANVKPANTVHSTNKPVEKADSKANENTGGKSNYNKNRNYKKKIYNNKRARFTKNSVDETVDEIKTDIRRIEKEIRLEIEEIKSLKV